MKHELGGPVVAFRLRAFYNASARRPAVEGGLFATSDHSAEESMKIALAQLRARKDIARIEQQDVGCDWREVWRESQLQKGTDK